MYHLQSAFASTPVSYQITVLPLNYIHPHLYGHLFYSLLLDGYSCSQHLFSLCLLSLCSRHVILNQKKNIDMGINQYIRRATVPILLSIYYQSLFFVCLFVWDSLVCVCVGPGVCIWKSKENLQKLTFFLHVCLKDSTQMISLSSKHYLDGPKA